MSEAVGLNDWLDRLASRSPSPSGGSAAAIALAMGCALGGMTARSSRSHLAAADDLLNRLESARADAVTLAGEDERAVQAAFGGGEPTVGADEALRLADIPAAIGRLAVEVRPILVRLADEGNPELRGDALAGAELVVAAGRAGLALVRLNLDLLDDEERARLTSVAEQLDAALR